MPKGQNAYKEILPYSVAMIQIGASEEEVVRYCDALGKLLEEATVLLRADNFSSTVLSWMIDHPAPILYNIDKTRGKREGSPMWK